MSDEKKPGKPGKSNRMRMTIRLMGGPVSGRRASVDRVTPVYLVQPRHRREVVWVYVRDQDGLDYFFDWEMAQAATRNAEKINASLAFEPLETPPALADRHLGAPAYYEDDDEEEDQEDEQEQQ